MKESLLNIEKNLLNRDNTLVNFSSSILKHFGVDPFHSTIKEVDEALKGHKKVAVFLFDGASEYNLRLYPRTNRFILAHKLKTIYSVNPATTVACTTAFLSAKFPIETGWLGWSLNFPTLGPIDVFTGKSSYSDKRYNPSPINEFAPYTNIGKILTSHGVNAKIAFEYPVENLDGPKNYREALRKYGDFFQKENGEFLYGYFKNPDHTIHGAGVKSFKTHWQFSKIAWFVKRFVKRNPDVIVFTFADHGLIDVTYDDVSAHKDLEDCLSAPISLDCRIPTFFVKEGRKEEFVTLFNRYFGNDYLLVSKEDAISLNYFGEGVPSKASLTFLGDYIGVAKGKVAMKEYFGKIDPHPCLAHHSGASKEEREVLLAVYNR